MPEEKRRPSVRATDALLLISGALLVLSAITLALVSLGWPYGPDHAIMTLVGRAWRLGSPPYTNYVDVKGPFAYVPYLLTDWLSGGSMFGLRLFDLAFVSAAAAVMYRTLQALVDRRVAAWSALLLFGLCFRVGHTESAQPDEWAALGTAMSFLLLLRHRAHPASWMFALAGVLVGAAALAKPQFAALGAVPIVVAVFWLTGTARTRALVALTVAAIIPVVVMCAVLYSQHALSDMFGVVTGPLMQSYLGERTIIPRNLSQLREVIRFPLTTSYGLPLSVLGCLGLLELRRCDRRLATALVTWIGLAVVLVMVQGRYYPYHWFPVLPPLCILAALAIRHSNASNGVTTEPRWRARSTVAVTVLALVALTSSFARRAVRSADLIAAARRDEPSLVSAIRNSVDPVGERRFASAQAAATYIAENAGPRREVGTWLYDATPLLLANVLPTAQLFFIHPILTGRSAVADSILRELAAELRRDAPPLIVIDCNAGWLDAKSFPERSPWLLQELATNYTRSFTSGAVQVFARRRDAAAATSAAGASAPTICGAGPVR